MGRTRALVACLLIASWMKGLPVCGIKSFTATQAQKLFVRDVSERWSQLYKQKRTWWNALTFWTGLHIIRKFGLNPDGSKCDAANVGGVEKGKQQKKCHCKDTETAARSETEKIHSTRPNSHLQETPREGTVADMLHFFIRGKRENSKALCWEQCGVRQSESSSTTKNSTWEGILIGSRKTSPHHGKTATCPWAAARTCPRWPASGQQLDGPPFRERPRFSWTQPFDSWNTHWSLRWS